MVDTTEPVHWRLLAAEDVARTCELMTRLKPSIARMTSPAMYSAICNDALSDDRVVIVLAEKGGDLVGFSLVLIDWLSYWRSFALHHPLLAAEIAFRRYIRGERRARTRPELGFAQRELINKCISPSSSSEWSWSDSSPQIAKGIYVWIAEAHRGKGLGRRLDMYRFRVLADRGVSRLDAHIAPENVASVLMHHRTGWEIVKTATGLWCTVDISPAREVTKYAFARTH